MFFLRGKARIQSKIDSAEKVLDQKRNIILHVRDPGMTAPKPPSPPGDPNADRGATASTELPTARQEAIAQFLSAWDVARLTLERYWLRNSGVSAILLLSSIASAMLGFVLLGWAAWHSIVYGSPTGINAAIMAGGVIVLAAFAFLAVYCIVEHQSIGFSRALERMYAIGIAWHVLELVPETDECARAEKWRGTLNLVTEIVSQTDSAHRK